MTKKLIKYLSFIFLLLVLIIIYLSFFGVTTKRLNQTIKNEILNFNNKVQLELKSVRILILIIGIVGLILWFFL